MKVRKKLNSFSSTGHSYNLETTAPKLATAPLVAAPALQYGVWLQVLSGYGQI